jgi:norsolorinic acid ketoreductase
MATQNNDSVTTVLITGANRGIGRGFLEVLLQRPNHLVIAAVRSVSSPSATEIENLPTGSGSKAIVVKIDSEVEDDPKNAIQLLEQKHGIQKLDVLIANAGIGDNYDSASQVSASQMKRFFNINAVAPLLLFQAAASLLKKSDNPKFFTVSSRVGSLGDLGKLPILAAAYGTSKAAVNFLTKQLHCENEWLVSIALSPGWVQTDMGNATAKLKGMGEAPMTLEQSVSGLLKVVWEYLSPSSI